MLPQAKTAVVEVHVWCVCPPRKPCYLRTIAMQVVYHYCCAGWC